MDGRDGRWLASSSATQPAVDRYVPSERTRPPPAAGLVRERLERPLTGAGAPALVFVIAPAGSGKTTLLARLARASHDPVAWYRLTPADAAEAVLAAGLARALQASLAPGLTLNTLCLEEVLESVDAAVTGPGLLVLDDLHTIGDSRAELALERFVTLRPPGLRVAVGSRHEPGWNMTRLLVCDSAGRVGGDALRFRYWEVEDLFSRVYSAPLGPEAAAALTRRTGGWAAGLQLFHLATAGRGAAERRRAVSALGGRSGLVRSYLARNVLADLPAERSRFLVLTSTLGLLTGSLCDAVLETRGSSDVLEELARQQLFTSSSDDGQTYRYHPVLEAHLHAALVERYGSQGAASRFARSARLLETACHHREAVVAYARAEDWGAVARLLQGGGDDAATAGVSGGERLLKAGHDAADPWLTLALARLRLRQGNIRAAVRMYRDAQSMLDEPMFRSTCRDELARAAAWLPEPAPGAGRSTDWCERIRRATRQTLEEGRHPFGAAGSAAGRHGAPTDADQLAEGIVALLGGNLEAAAVTLSRVARIDDASPLTRIAVKLVLALVDLLGERSDDPLAVLEQAVLEAEVAGHPFLARVATALLEANLVYVGGAAARRTAYHDLIAACERDDDEWGAALTELVIGFASRAAGHPEPLGSLDDAAFRFRALRAPVLAAWAEAGKERAASTSRRRPDAASATVPVNGRAEPDDVRIVCLGDFRCEFRGGMLDWRGTRPRAVMLLRVLAVAAGRPLHREHLVDVLWPGVDVESGTRQLQVAVSSLRRVLNGAGLPGSDVLRRRGEAYALELPLGCVDVQLLESALNEMHAALAARNEGRCVVAAEAVLRHYTGDLLPGDGPAEWVVHDRERLRRGAATAATMTAEDRRRRGNLGGAVTAAERAVELDPYADRAWTLLAALHDASGDRAAAARCRRDHARLLAELGVL